MKLKITRRVRTATSEQWSLLDDELNENEAESDNVGKVDIHYTEEMVHITLTLWREYVSDASEEDVQNLIDEVIQEAVAPSGVATFYGVDIFMPSLSDYRFITNDDDDDDDDDDDENTAKSNGFSSLNP